MGIFDDILARAEFADAPPILMDIGASGLIHENWKVLARHSIAIAFDADDREMKYIERAASGFKKMYVYNAVAGIDGTSPVEFHLTRSPYCSSTLKPKTAALGDWAFAHLFDVQQTKMVRAVTPQSILNELQIGRVDWFKTDSQGTDLRLFQSLDLGIQSKALAVEFEPGVMDAYEGEDNLSAVLAFMQTRGFWLAQMQLQGTQRMAANELDRLGPILRHYVSVILKTSHGWCELVYLNTFKKPELFSLRDMLLGWVIASIQKQHGFALHIARVGSQRHADPIFDTLARESLYRIKKGLWRLPAHWIREAVRLVSGHR